MLTCTLLSLQPLINCTPVAPFATQPHTPYRIRVSLVHCAAAAARPPSVCLFACTSQSMHIPHTEQRPAATHLTVSVCPLYTALQLPPAHLRSVWSPLPLSSYSGRSTLCCDCPQVLPICLHPTKSCIQRSKHGTQAHLTVSVCPLYTAVQLFPAHLRSVWSPLPLSSCPSSVTARHSTGPSWPNNWPAGLPPRHSRIVLQ
jgi:hypothetical protein